MPVASAATSASRIAISARPKRLWARLKVIQVQSAAGAEAEPEEPRGGVERRRQLGPGQADAAACHALPGERDLRHDGGEAERADGEVEGP